LSNRSLLLEADAALRKARYKLGAILFDMRYWQPTLHLKALRPSVCHTF